MKTYEALAAALCRQLNGAPIFHLIGDGNIGLCGALAARGANMVATRHEGGAVAMADGYFRATGNVGFTSITHGPGLTHAATAIAAASKNRSSLIIVTGEVPKSAANRIQEIEQATLVAACGAEYIAIDEAADAARAFAKAIESAVEQRQPVVVAMAVDLQNRQVETEWGGFPVSPGSPLPQSADTDALEKLANRMSKAARPVIVAGRGARGAKEAISDLARACGALIGTTLQAKGLFAGHPADIGIVGSYSSYPATRLLAESDLVVSFGAEMGFYSTEGGKLFRDAALIRIDTAPASRFSTEVSGEQIRLDAEQAARSLAHMISAKASPNASAKWLQMAASIDVPEAEAKSIPSDGMDPVALARIIGNALHKEVVVTCGVGHFTAFPAMHMPVHAGAEIIFSVQFAAVGQTLPVSVGVALGGPNRQHLLIEGDGSLMMNLHELETAARIGRQFAVLVWNDGGLGAEFHKLAVDGHDPALAIWPSPDFAAIARALGGDGVRVERVEDVPPALKRALAHPGLFIIDARVSPSVVSDYTLRRFVPAAQNHAAHLGLPDS